jgi:hypothetical protein
MAAPKGFVSYSILDAKGKKSTTQINFPIDNMDSEHLDVLIDFAGTTAELIDAIIRGQIVDVGIGISVDLTSLTLKGTPVASSDVEEGARFQFSTVLNTLTGFRLPTFDEDFINAGSNTVDIEDTDVDAFVDRIVEGRTITLTNVSPSDDRGEDIVALVSARESFQSSRT